MMVPARDEIIAIIAQEARIDEAKLTDDATLVSLDMSSLDLVSVLFAVEDRYGVEIQIEDLGSAKTLGEFVGILYSRIAAA
jgi:acyl carrier protein